MSVAIVDVATAFPPHYYDQETLTTYLRDAFWEKGRRNVERLERFHQNMAVNGRYLALPLEQYGELHGFGASNDAWIDVAADLSERVLCKLLDRADVDPATISQLTVTTVTGVAVPTLDARLMNRLPFSPTLKRVPLFGLGCLGGAAGVARVADYLDGHPQEAAILLSVELCSLTVQPDDLSIANVISTGLFGDGAAAVLMVGEGHPLAASARPHVVASSSYFFRDTERVMGWDVTDEGFQVVLSADVPEIARDGVRPAVTAFLALHDLSLEDVSHWVAHPGGPKVIKALEEGLGLGEEGLQLSRESLAEVGNVSSASILFILRETLSRFRPSPGTYGMMLAMGPAFCAEMVLLQW
ncbi:MAG: 3-oxoacyl-[acyl-carrier-protein] synthase III C-terminal domain-containing protein [Candidatus Promineifilaceae bacterium]|nr:3-oxoacyl-[acyl-carrier-protein] synthase III C-terminal domain-containing protein [Candidatus Promineifilaceae bacterium]